MNTETQTQTIEVYRKPTAFEIKQGYGAIHYLTVPLSAIYTVNGVRRTWILNPYVADNLRYYVPK